jgi:hypothetical protein
MRAFTDGNGNDSTSAVIAHLEANRQLYLADLYLLGELEDPNAVWLTNWNSPLSWPVWSSYSSTKAFNPAVIKRGKVTSQIGLQVDNLDITWSPPLTAFGTTVATQNQYQKAQNGFFDNWKMRVWRCVMPTPGDANTYGACQWFGGWNSDTEIGRGYVKFSVQSFLNVVNQKVPPNVIESSNAQANYSGGVPSLADGETQLPVFEIIVPSSASPPLSQTAFLGYCLSPTPGKIYDTPSHYNKFALGYVQFLPGSSLAGYWSPVATDYRYDAGGGTYYNYFQVFLPFPWTPSPGDQFYASTQLPVDYATALSTASGIFKGFPYVPPPASFV